MIGFQGIGESHAVKFVPHHLGPVKGSSPDVIPLIYLFILVDFSNNTPYAFGNNKINKVISITSVLRCNQIWYVLLIIK